MRYEKYQSKMNRVSAILKGAKRHRVLIIVLVAAVMALLVGFLSVKGVVYIEEMPKDFVYGETLEFRVDAFFGGTSYEYCSESSQEWSSDLPTRAGNYRVRAVTKRAFGIPSYTEAREFRIMPKRIDVIVAQDLIPYGENPMISAELVAGDVIDCGEFDYVDPSQAETEVVPVVHSLVITDSNGEDVTDSYEIRAVSKRIAFVKRTIAVTVEDRTAIYDGTPLSFDGCEVTEGSLAAGDTLIAVFDRTQTEVGETENVPELRILNPNGFDVTGRYEMETHIGRLVVEKRTILVETQSATRVYDGQPFSNTQFKLGANTPLVEGHRLVLTGSASLTDVGSCENLLSFRIMHGGEDVTENYTLLFPNDSILTITPRVVTVRTSDKNKTYDGKPLVSAATDFAVISEAKLVGTHRLSLTFTGARTTVGTAENRAEKARVFDGVRDVTTNYSVEYEYGTLEVTLRNITVTIDSRTWVYDGAEHSSSARTVTGDGIASGQTSRVVGTLSTVRDVLRNGNQIVGTENRFAVEIFEGSENVTSNYAITYQYGTLTITPRSVTLKPEDKSKVYDAGALMSNAVIVGSETKLVEGHLLNALCNGSQTDVGTGVNRITSITVRSGSVDVSANYSITFETGTLTVTPRQITVKAGDASKVYDAKPLTDGRYSVVSSLQLVNGHTLSAHTSGTRTVVGKSENRVAASSVIIKANGVDVTKNYKIDMADGVLTVTPRPITVKTFDASKVYDSTELRNERFELKSVLEQALAENQTSRLLSASGITDVGTRANEVVVAIFAGNTDVTANYVISYELGTLEVTPRKLTLTTGSAEKVYDGKPLTFGEYVLSGALATGQRAVVSVTGQITNIGSVSNAAEARLYAGAREVSGNYEITYTLGTLTVKPDQNTIVVHLYEKRKAYDGTPLTYAEDDYWTEMPDGLRLELRLFGSITEVGVLPLSELEKIPHTVFDQNGKNVTGKYSLIFKGEPLRVDSRAITVSSGSASKPYDGKPLTSADFWISLGVLPTGFRIETIIVGTVTEIGKAENTIDSVIIYDQKGQDVTRFFDIQILPGTLTIKNK